MIQERVTWAAAPLLLCVVAAYAIATGGIALLVVVGLACVSIVAMRPSAALLAIIPVAMWPEQPIAGGFPLTYGLVAVVEVGVLIGSVSRLPDVRKPLGLTLAFTVIMSAAFLAHGAPSGVTQSEQRNHFIAFMLSVWLVPIAALARPSLKATLRMLTLSSVAASAYSFVAADRIAGRASFEQFNSDVLGCAAAASILLVITTARIERRMMWLWLLPAPGLAFMAAQTRSALVVLVVGLLVMWLLARIGPTRVIVMSVGLAALPFLVGPALALQRALFSQRDARYLEVDSRFRALELAFGLTRSEPLLGVGYRHFPDESINRLGVAINAHNDFALLAAENGVFAAALFVLLLSRVITFRHPDRVTDTALRSLLIAVLLAFAFGNLLTDLRMTMPGWLLLGLAWTFVTAKGADPAEVNPNGDRVGD